MPRHAATLKAAAKGGWMARRRIPRDVREAYDVGHEARLVLPPMSKARAMARHQEWLAEVTTRIENIRVERRGEGRAGDHHHAGR